MKREIKCDIKLLIKLSLIFFGLLFMLCILLGRRERKQEPPTGDKIAVQDVEILLDALGINMPEITQEDTHNLTYGMYVTIRQALQDKVPEHVSYPHLTLPTNSRV